MSLKATELDEATVPLVGNETVYLVQNGNDVQCDSADLANIPTSLSLVTNTGTTLTLANSTHNGRVVECGNAANTTVTLPNTLPVGFNCLLTQTAAGNIVLSPAANVTLRNRQSHTRSAGQWAVCSLYVRANANGTAAEYVFGGDTAT